MHPRNEVYQTFEDRITNIFFCHSLCGLNALDSANILNFHRFMRCDVKHNCDFKTFLVSKH